MRLHHAAVVCRSKENADRFYGGILGLKPVKSANLSADLAQRIFGAPRGCDFFFYTDDDLAIEVFVAEVSKEKIPRFPHLCLEVEDRDAFLSRCESKGFRVNRVQRGDSELNFLEDDDGNLFEIKARLRSYE